jgi:hypothetical protein
MALAPGKWFADDMADWSSPGEPPSLEFVGTLEVRVAPAINVGSGPAGERRVVSIRGGRASGPRLEDEILPVGADIQLIRPDGVTEVEARYVIRLNDDALVYVVNRGLRDAAPDDMAQLLRDEPVPPERLYFRTSPTFETGSPAHARLLRHVFVGIGERQPEAVCLRICRV